MKHLLLLTAIFMTLPAFGQRKSPHDTISNDNVTVTYGRPYKNNRVIFDGLVKFGTPWRLGADEATTITFKKDSEFGGKPIKAGTYTMVAIPNAKEWTIILNSQLGQWGAFDYEKNKAMNVLQINTPARKLDKPVEQLTMRLVPDRSLVIEWEQTQVVVAISHE